VVLIAASFLSPRQVRRVALVVFLVSIALIFVALLYGHEIKDRGAGSSAYSLRVSETGLRHSRGMGLSEAGKRRDVPANLLALLLLLVTIVPLILQPDFGQTMLVSLVWMALFFMAGLHWLWVAGLGGAGVGAALLAYKLVPHVPRPRPQIHRSWRWWRHGRYVSGGHGARLLPVRRLVRQGTGRRDRQAHSSDAHTDFIFAVTSEEFGVLACLLIASIFAFIVLRGLSMAARNEDLFAVSRRPVW